MTTPEVANPAPESPKVGFNRRYEIVTECPKGPPGSLELAAALEPTGVVTYITSVAKVHFPGKPDADVLTVSTIINGDYDPLESLAMCQTAGAVAKICGSETALLTLVPIQSSPVDQNGRIVQYSTDEEEPGLLIAKDGSAAPGV